MARDALTPAQHLAELMQQGRFETAIRELAAIHPTRMRRAVVARLEPLLSEDDRRWFWRQWSKRQRD